MSAPIYYFAMEQARFGSLRAACTRFQWPMVEVQHALDNAKFHRSAMAVMAQCRLGDPENKICAGLVLHPGGAVSVMACFFGEASEDRKEVEEFAKVMMAVPDLKARPAFIGEFIPALSRELPQ